MSRRSSGSGAKRAKEFVQDPRVAPVVGAFAKLISKAVEGATDAVLEQAEEWVEEAGERLGKARKNVRSRRKPEEPEVIDERH